MPPHDKHTTPEGKWGGWQGGRPACMRAAGRFAGDSAQAIRFPPAAAAAAQTHQGLHLLAPCAAALLEHIDAALLRGGSQRP